VALAVAALVAFGVAFAVDAALVNRTYDALRSDHVVVQPSDTECYDQPVGFKDSNPNPRTAPGFLAPNVCYLSFKYGNRSYSTLVAIDAPRTLFVDPRDPGIEMTADRFRRGAVNVVGDVILSAGLLSSAVALAVMHQVHLRRRRHAARRAPGTRRRTSLI
jgi:hypothetical protein